MIIRNAEVLNSKRIKEITTLLREQWGFDEKIPHGFLQKQNDVFVSSRDIDKIELSALNVNSVGMYFAELRNGQLRLSIEGTQMIGPKAKHNVVELSDTEWQLWLSGGNIPTEEKPQHDSFVMVRHGNDFYGCGRIKDGMLLNFVPKARRATAVRT
jgi:NOL1/NOP2/fmu family ribosome biogenesis protein